jgi:elongation factor G
MMEAASDQRLGRMIIVNKIDAENVNLGKIVEDIREAFGSECLPINLPTADGSGVVDCFFEPNGAETAFDTVGAAHERMRLIPWTPLTSALSTRSWRSTKI